MPGYPRARSDHEEYPRHPHLAQASARFDVVAVLPGPVSPQLSESHPGEPGLVSMIGGLAWASSIPAVQPPSAQLLGRATASADRKAGGFEFLRGRTPPSAPRGHRPFGLLSSGFVKTGPLAARSRAPGARREAG